MPVDLPDISFNQGRIDLSRYDNRYFQNSNLNLIGYRTREQLLFNANLDPKIIIKEAFEKYIVNTPIESNSIGINIIYRRNRTSGVKNIFIAKRNFEGETTQNIYSDSPEPEYIRDATNTNVFENNEIDAVLERSFGRIIQVTLCESIRRCRTRSQYVWWKMESWSWNQNKQIHSSLNRKNKTGWKE